MTTRAEHLEWCKQRAYEYLDRGELVNALASFGSDVCKHEETKNIDLTVAVRRCLTPGFDLRGYIQGVE